MLVKITKIFTLAFAMAIVGGCADMSRIDALQATADAALAEARSASATANNALSVANEANSAAAEAKSNSTTALECCNDNTAKLDRMFEKAMRK